MWPWNSCRLPHLRVHQHDATQLPLGPVAKLKSRPLQYAMLLLTCELLACPLILLADSYLLTVLSGSLILMGDPAKGSLTAGSVILEIWMPDSWHLTFNYPAVFPDDELADQKSVVIQFDGDPAADDPRLSQLTSDERLRLTGRLSSD